jgi:hypothetical protein
MPEDTAQLSKLAQLEETKRKYSDRYRDQAKPDFRSAGHKLQWEIQNNVPPEVPEEEDEDEGNNLKPETFRSQSEYLKWHANRRKFKKGDASEIRIQKGRFNTLVTPVRRGELLKKTAEYMSTQTIAPVIRYGEKPLKVFFSHKSGGSEPEYYPPKTSLARSEQGVMPAERVVFNSEPIEISDPTEQTKKLFEQNPQLHKTEAVHRYHEARDTYGLTLEQRLQLQKEAISRISNSPPQSEIRNTNTRPNSVPIQVENASQAPKKDNIIFLQSHQAQKKTNAN